MSVILPGRVSIENDVVFGSGGGRDLKCDVYTPPGEVKNAPAVLLVHGGGWFQGDRSELKGYGVLLGRIGYVCVSTEYRLTPESPWPAQIEDVKACLRWMRTNSERLGIDPTKIAVSGNSAGGHLSLMVATTPNEPEFEGSGGNAGVDTSVAASIAFYPPTQLRDDDVVLSEAVQKLMGKNPSEAAMRGVRPLTHVKAGLPPVMLIHGNNDRLVSPKDSFVMYEALAAAAVPVELHMFAEAPHGFDATSAAGRLCAETMSAFLDRYVAHPHKWEGVGQA
jgi:acetyl esterase/lipase